MRTLLTFLCAMAIAFSLGVASIPASPVRAQSLLSAVWELRQLPDESAMSDASSRYTIQFFSNGTVSVQADCNSATGRWGGELDGGPLDITITLPTLAGCPTTRGLRFLDFLDQVDSATLSWPRLTLSIPLEDMDMILEAAPI